MENKQSMKITPSSVHDLVKHSSNVLWDTKVRIPYNLTSQKSRDNVVYKYLINHHIVKDANSVKHKHMEDYATICSPSTLYRMTHFTTDFDNKIAYCRAEEYKDFMMAHQYNDYIMRSNESFRLIPAANRFLVDGDYYEQLIMRVYDGGDARLRLAFSGILLSKDLESITQDVYFRAFNFTHHGNWRVKGLEGHFERPATLDTAPLHFPLKGYSWIDLNLMLFGDRAFNLQYEYIKNRACKSLEELVNRYCILGVLKRDANAKYDDGFSSQDASRVLSYLDSIRDVSKLVQPNLKMKSTELDVYINNLHIIDRFNKDCFNFWAANLPEPYRYNRAHVKRVIEDQRNSPFYDDDHTTNIETLLAENERINKRIQELVAKAKSLVDGNTFSFVVIYESPYGIPVPIDELQSYETTINSRTFTSLTDFELRLDRPISHTKYFTLKKEDWVEALQGQQQYKIASLERDAMLNLARRDSVELEDAQASSSGVLTSQCLAQGSMSETLLLEDFLNEIRYVPFPIVKVLYTYIVYSAAYVIVKYYFYKWI